MTWKEIIYICADELKFSSDDSFYTNEHLVFLLTKYRAFLLKQRYSDIKKQISESNYQNICLDLIEVPAISGEPCEGSSYLRSSTKLPTTMMIGNPRVYPTDFYQGEISYISRERMRYVGYNRFLQNIIYCSKAPDGYLYFKSWNPQFLHLEKVRVSAVFEDAKEASALGCAEDGTTVCKLEDKIFPLEDSLTPPLVELVVKELRNPEFMKEDVENNAEDNLPDVR